MALCALKINRKISGLTFCVPSIYVLSLLNRREIRKQLIFQEKQNLMFYVSTRQKEKLHKTSRRRCT